MVDEEEAVADSPPKACGPVRLPATATRVVDADEEVFLLYTSLAARGPCNGLTGFRGLGHIDSHHDTLTIEFTLDEPHDSTAQGPTQSSTRQKSKKLARQEQTLTVELFQDKTALRSRKGDTGSVLWHASVDFARTVLRQHHARAADALLDPDLLKHAHVLELG